MASVKLKKKSKRVVKKTKDLDAGDGVGPSQYEVYRAALDAPRADPSLGSHPTMHSTKKTPVICEAILVLLAKGHTPAVVAGMVHVARSTMFTWRREDEAFREQWDEAVEAGVDLLEEEIIRRARDGVDRPVFQQGTCVGMVREYSDSLASILLQGRRRKVYGRNAEESDGQNVSVTIHGGLPDTTNVKSATVTVTKKDKT